MHVRFTQDAKDDLQTIKNYLQPLSPQGLERILSAIFTIAAQLETFPFLGRKGRVDGTYEILVPRTPFMIIYSIADETFIDIDRIMHTKRRYPLKA